MTSWLRAQKKSELVDIADAIGLDNVTGLKKTDLEAALDEFLIDNASRLSSDPTLAPYFNIRAKSSGSPVKREFSETKVARRRTIRPAASQDEIVAAAAAETDAPLVLPSTATNLSQLVRTPARTLSLAGRITLPSSPADVALAVDRSAVAVRERVVSIYADSGITEATHVTRESLSTVYSIITLVSLFEWYFLRPEILPTRYAFSIPAIAALGTVELPVQLPDLFQLLTASFWLPALVWLHVGLLVPAFFGYFFNLSAASGSHHTGRGRSRPFSHAEYTVDPLTFSVAKALLVFVVFAQGATFGVIDPFSVTRINAALYGGWKGALVGTAVTGVTSLYDAVLRK